MTACYVAARLAPSTRVFRALPGRRAGAPAVLRQFGLLVAILVGAYVLALIPAVVITAARAEYGHPDLLVMVSGVLAMAAAVAVGYLIGVLGRRILWVPVTFLALFIVSMPNVGGDSILAPTHSVVVQLGRHEALPVVVYRCALYVLVGSVAVIISARHLGQGRHAASVRWQSVALTALPVLLAVPAVLRPPTFFVPDAIAPAVCEHDGQVEYCVHVGHRSELGVLHAEGSQLLALYGYVPPQARRIYDTALVQGKTGELPGTLVGLSPHSGVHGSVRDAVAGSLASPPCSAELPAGTDERALVQTYVYEWLYHDGVVTSKIDEFNPWIGVSRAEVQRRIWEHRDRFENCTATLADMR